MSEITDQLKRLLEKCQTDIQIDKHENARLLPIIQAQNAVIERLSEALRLETLDIEPPFRYATPEQLKKHKREALLFAEQELERVMK